MNLNITYNLKQKHWNYANFNINRVFWYRAYTLQRAGAFQINLKARIRLELQTEILLNL